MLTKEALTRLGKMLAAGRLSAEQIKKLRAAGALRSVERYTQGMHKGNLAIAEKLGLGDDVAKLLKRKDRVLVGVSTPSGIGLKDGKAVFGKADTVAVGPNGQWGLAQSPKLIKIGPPAPVVGYTGFGSKYAPVRGIRGGFQRFKHALGATVDQQRQAASSFAGLGARNPSAKHVVRTPKVYSRMIGTDEGARALVNRHELDELRELARLSAKGSKSFEAGARIGSQAPGFQAAYGHVSPRVLVNEARNAQALAPEAIEHLRRARRSIAPLMKGRAPRETEMLGKLRAAGGKYGVGGVREIPESYTKSPGLLTRALSGVKAVKKPEMSALL
jgi:hypothetical protein